MICYSDGVLDGIMGCSESKCLGHHLQQLQQQEQKQHSRDADTIASTGVPSSIGATLATASQSIANTKQDQPQGSFFETNIKDDGEPVEGTKEEEEAAVRIQAAFKGYTTRRALKERPNKDSFHLPN